MDFALLTGRSGGFFFFFSSEIVLIFKTPRNVFITLEDCEMNTHIPTTLTQEMLNFCNTPI